MLPRPGLGSETAGLSHRGPGSMGGPGRLPWCPLSGWCARASLSLPHQGYGDHKPKSSTAAQEVKTLDGIFTEQVSGEQGEKVAQAVLVCLCPPHAAWSRLPCPCAPLWGFLVGDQAGTEASRTHPEGHRPCPAQPVRSSVGACSCLHLAFPRGCGAGGGVRPLRAPALVTETRGACPSHEAGLWFRGAEGAAGLCWPSVSRPAGGAQTVGGGLADTGGPQSGPF